ncbi:MAG: MBL fold metallo-hydrolase, partial [Verrucomicrobiota bacterium]|nr:MBL fold metallo-hydrolase [Verrucomicrobiota bacterium]
MRIEAVPTGTFEEICYIVWNENKQTVVFDPGFDEELISRTMENHALDVVAYVCTHGHADHIGALADLHD